MRRMIKIRAWVIDHETMYQVEDLHLGSMGVSFRGTSNKGYTYNFGIGSNFILMQTLPFQDKANKDIYEGDIVQAKSMVDDDLHIGVIEEDSFFPSGWEGNIEPEEFIVIGNIHENHENPTLLKDLTS